MSVEELGRVADATRDYIYSSWDYYQHVKQYGLMSDSKITQHLLKMGKAVEECYGPKPETWVDE